jgi:hypothetical protein
VAFSLSFCKIVYFWPMIIPQIEFSINHLLMKIRVVMYLQWYKCDWRGALYYWLAFTKQRKRTVLAIISSKLFCGCDYNEVFTVSYKDCALTWRYIYFAALCIVYIDICSYIKYKVLWVLAIVDVVLLSLDGVNFLNSERLFLVFELIVVGVIFFPNGLWLQYVWIRFFLCLYWFLNLLYRLRLLCLQLIIRIKGLSWEVMLQRLVLIDWAGRLLFG